MLKKISIISLLICTAVQSNAITLDWSGVYRAEYTEIDRPSLADGKERKAYGLNFLYLQPKIVASDGINVVSRFNVLTNSNPAYQDSQLGSILGSGTMSEPRLTAEHQNSMPLYVSQLYLNINQEYGSIVVGRAPIEFGMGMTHNAGNGLFDHWSDTRDVVGYKFWIDNLSFMPMLGKVYQKDFGQGVTVSDQILVMEYDNKDIGAKAGVFHETRRSSIESNNATATLPAGVLHPTQPATLVAGGTSQLVNLFFGRDWKSFQFKLEASFLTGDTGFTVGTDSVSYNAYAIAGEVLFPATEGSKWEFSGKFGVVSGDDPNTTNKYEGYQLDRNYEVGFLLFNHRMGQRDFLTSGLRHASDYDSTGKRILDLGNSADDEAVGNAMYIAPSVKYMWNDKFDVRSTLVYAQTMVNPTNSGDFQKDLGAELDIELTYKPRERVTWSTQLGYFLPGGAWKDGSNGLENKSNYGFTTKAAISF